jgi:hypothetical protein
MARPTPNEAAMKRIAESCTTSQEDLGEVITWAENELRIAQDAFDKPRQARIARLMINVSRLTLTLSSISREAGQ